MDRPVLEGHRGLEGRHDLDRRGRHLGHRRRDRRVRAHLGGHRCGIRYRAVKIRLRCGRHHRGRKAAVYHRREAEELACHHDREAGLEEVGSVCASAELFPPRLLQPPVMLRLEPVGLLLLLWLEPALRLQELLAPEREPLAQVLRLLQALVRQEPALLLQAAPAEEPVQLEPVLELALAPVLVLEWEPALRPGPALAVLVEPPRHE